MSQESVIGFLKKNEGWYTGREIAEATDKGTSTTYINLKRLKKGNFIKFRTRIKSGFNHPVLEYKYKR